MGFLKLPQTLSRRDLPDEDVASLAAGGEHLTVPGEGEAQHRLLHHHEVLRGLVLQILPDLARGEVPHFNEAVHGAGDEVLTVRTEYGGLYVGLGSELDLPGQLGRELLVLLLPHCGLAPEQVDLTAGWEESLVLLPLEGLAQQGCNIALINNFIRSVVL